MNTKASRGYFLAARRALTLSELLLVVAIVALLTASMAPAIRAAHRGSNTSDRRSEVLQNDRVGIDQVSRVLRETTRLYRISGPSDGLGYIEFFNKASEIYRFERTSGSDELRYGPLGTLSLLAGPITSFLLTSFDGAGNVLPDPVQVARVRSVKIDLVTTDQEGKASPIPSSFRVFFRKDLNGPSGLINEIMYDPRNPDPLNEWIEFYASDADIDAAGWKLTTLNNEASPDTISGDPRYGTGSSVIPRGGYAVITDRDTEVHKEVLHNRSFEDSNLNDWRRSGGWSRIQDGDVHDGLWKFERNGSGWMYQDRNIPRSAVSSFVSFWEKSPTPAGTQLTVTLRNRSNRVLATLYDGPMHSTWTLHTADITDYQAVKERLHFQTGTGGPYWLDDISESHSLVHRNGIRLRVQDSTLGGEMRNRTDALTVTDDSGDLMDMVTYDSSWGGQDNSRTLERIDTYGDSMDPANWAEGPRDGTPGDKNQASP